jgi:hypothetical protein
MPADGFFLFSDIQKRFLPLLISLVVAGGVSGLTAARAHADQVNTLCTTLRDASDDKARIASAVALGRLADRRSVPALSHALTDRNAIVRAVAATALGHIGDPSAIPALEAALKDVNPAVRARCAEALEKLQQSAHLEEPRPAALPAPAKPTARAIVVLKSMHNPTGHGRPELTVRMRELVLERLRRSPDVALDKASAPRSVSEFALDGVITKLSTVHTGRFVEITCQVTLTVSTAKGRIVSIVSGSATVQAPRSAYREGKELALETDALAAAVTGAERNLLSFLGQRVAAVP